MSPETAVQLSLTIPLAGAVLIVIAGRYPNLRESVTLGSAILLFTVVSSLLPEVLNGEQPAWIIAEPVPGLPLHLQVEPLGMLFGLVASFLWIVTSVYSIGYMRGHHEKNQTRFYCCFAIALASAIGVAFAANMFTLFVFYELLTISTYPLVTHSGTDEAKQAGRVYLGILLSTSMGVLLLAIVWTWNLAGTLTFTAGGILTNVASPVTLSILYALYVFGIGKAALMPLHRWLPAAMVAPTPVSALLHAVAVVKAGVFAILKISIYVFGLDLLANEQIGHWLLYVAGATIVIGSVVAMTQDNLKLRLAYSTVSQLSYVILGALLANAAGIVGGAMHIAMHAFGKITLFFCAGAIMVAAHKTQISEMRGIGRTMPITMLAFFVGSLSIIGLPPMGGMWSKWFLAWGTLEAKELALLIILMLSSLLNVAYLLPIPIRAFFSAENPAAHTSGIREAPPTCLAAIIVTSAACLTLFFYPELLYRLASMLVQ